MCSVTFLFTVVAARPLMDVSKRERESSCFPLSSLSCSARMDAFTVLCCGLGSATSWHSLAFYVRGNSSGKVAIVCVLNTYARVPSDTQITIYNSGEAKRTCPKSSWAKYTNSHIVPLVDSTSEVAERRRMKKGSNQRLEL